MKKVICLNNKNNSKNNRFPADVPSTHNILTEMPDGAYFFDCLSNLDGKGWQPIEEIHPMCDLHIEFVKDGLIAFRKK